MIISSDKKMHNIAIYILCIYSCVFSQLYSMELISPQLESFIPVLCCFCLILAGRIEQNKNTIVWILPLIVLAFNLILHFTFGLLRDFVMWVVGFLLVTGYCNLRVLGRAAKVLYFGGAIYAMSVLLEYIFPDLYFSYYYPLFKGDYAEVAYRMWTSSKNIASGLSHQIGFTICYIVVGLGLLVFNQLKEKTRPANLFLLALFAITLILGKKRLHFAASLLSLGFVYICSSSSKDRNKKIVLMLTIIVAVLFISLTLLENFGFTSVFDRYEESMELRDSGDSLSASRDVLRAYALSLWFEHPIFGIGWNQFSQSGADYTTVHNVFIQLLCETGIVGLLCVMTPIISTIKKTYNLVVELRDIEYEYKGLLLFSLFYQSFFIMYFFTGNPLYDYPYLIPYFLSVTIFYCIDKWYKL